jgi:hypothetical protein
MGSGGTAEYRPRHGSALLIHVCCVTKVLCLVAIQMCLRRYETIHSTRPSSVVLHECPEGIRAFSDVTWIPSSQRRMETIKRVSVLPSVAYTDTTHSRQLFSSRLICALSTDNFLFNTSLNKISIPKKDRPSHITSSLQPHEYSEGKCSSATLARTVSLQI